MFEVVIGEWHFQMFEVVMSSKIAIYEYKELDLYSFYFEYNEEQKLHWQRRML